MPSPDDQTRHRLSNLVRGASPWLVAAVVLALLPYMLRNSYHQYILNVVLINVILAIGLNIVKGFAGQITLGHIALAAIGAYTSAVLSATFGFSFWLALPASIAVTALAGAIVGIPSFRLEGAYLALATLGLAESVRIIISGTDALGGAVGFQNIPPPFFGGVPIDDYRSYYYIVMPIALLAVYLALSILQSDAGRSFKAIREDSLAAAASGINVRKYKTFAFVLSAAYAGCAGSLQAHMSPGFLNPDNYTIAEMITLQLMVVAGGLGNVWGGIIGAVLVTIFDVFTREFYLYRMIIFGSAGVLLVIFLPRGVGGLVQDHFVRRRFKDIREAKRAGPEGVNGAA